MGGIEPSCSCSAGGTPRNALNRFVSLLRRRCRWQRRRRAREAFVLLRLPTGGSALVGREVKDARRVAQLAGLVEGC